MHLLTAFARTTREKSKGRCAHYFRAGSHYFFSNGMYFWYSLGTELR